MKTTNSKKQLHLLPALGAVVILSLLLSACGGISMSSSPEAAAVREVSNQSGGRSGFMIDQNSIQVLQTTVLGDRTFVLVSYEGMEGSLGGAKSSCLTLYQMRKGLFGMWSPSTGNGSCETKINISGDSPNEAPPQPISIGGGRAGGNGKSDPGHSMASGKVFDDTVKAVKVTWQDGTSQQADVINASYLIVRVGEMEWMKVEALDEKGNVVFNWQPEVAPGKK